MRRASAALMRAFASRAPFPIAASAASLASAASTPIAALTAFASAASGLQGARAAQTIPSNRLQDELNAIRRDVRRGPVLVTDAGHEDLVILSAEHYRALAGARPHAYSYRADDAPDEIVDLIRRQPPAPGNEALNDELDDERS